MGDVLRLPFHSLRFSSSLITSFASSFNSLKPALPPNQNHSQNNKRVYPLSYSLAAAAPFAFTPRKQLVHFKVQARIAEKEDQPKWWERSVPNMVDIHSTQEFLSALAQAGDRLVIVEFYGTWCASCRALFPKMSNLSREAVAYLVGDVRNNSALIAEHASVRYYSFLNAEHASLCRTAEDHPEILFLKVNFDENKPMCKSMNVKVLPYFHFYRGADGQLESFSCSLAKFQKIKDAIALHNTDRCSIGPPKGVGDLILEPSLVSKDKPSESTSS